MELPFSDLAIQMIAPGYPQKSGKQVKPKLKLEAVKGLEFLQLLNHMLANMFAHTTPHEELRLQCVSALAQVYQ